MGDGAVGKTSLIRKFVVDNFSDGYVATVGAKVTKKDVHVERGLAEYEVSLIIWDILGQKGFNAVQSNSFLGSRGVILVYDVTRPHTADSLMDYWMPMLRKVSKDAPIILFGNKLDLVSDKESARVMAKRLAHELGCEYYLTSAKTGENVETGFRSLVQEMMAAVESELEVISSVTPIPLEATTVNVADRIMVDFCNDFGGIETGSPILREQFTRAGLDLKNPSMDGLLRAIDLLADVERSFKSDPDVEKQKSKWIGWVRDIKRP